MYHLSSIYFSSPLNIQGLFCDGHNRNLYDSENNVLQIHHIQYFILKVGDYVNYQPNDNGPK